VNDHLDPQLELMLDAVVFAHEAEQQPRVESPQSREFERAAALAAAAFAGAEEPPKALANRLAASGLQFCAERRRTLANADGGARPRLASTTPGFVTGADRAPRRSGTLFGFLTGLAAALLIWFFATKPPAPVDLSVARQQLLASSGVQQLEWKAGPSPLSGAVKGDVVWSEAEQTGYLTFEGLPPVGPEQRFQLWIVDGARKDSDPVDGGLFAITDAAGRTIVPIDAKLPVAKAAAFVVTVEDKAGVVVSKQKHVVAIAGL